MANFDYDDYEDRKLDRLLTIDELCKLLKLPKHSIYYLTAQKRIPHIKVGNQLRFRESSIMKWIEEQERRIMGGSLQDTKQKKGNVGRVIDVAKRQKV